MDARWGDSTLKSLTHLLRALSSAASYIARRFLTQLNDDVARRNRRLRKESWKKANRHGRRRANNAAG